MNPLDSLFEWLFATSIRASVVAGAILAIQFLLRPWLPANWRYPLWFPLLLVLVIPVVTEVPFHPFPVEEPAAATVSSAVELKAVANMETQAAPVAAEPPVIRPKTIALGWLVGAMIVLGVGITGYWKSLRRILRDAANPDDGLQTMIHEAAKEIGLARTPRILMSSAMESAAVTGFFRSLLLLPKDFPSGFTPAEARLVVLHELTHLKRHDLAVNWLTCGLQTMHWFNPILWFAFARMRADRETACDAGVLSHGANDCRADYGRALLKLQSVPSLPGFRLGFVGMFEAGASLRSRIEAISRHRRNHPVWSIAGVAMIVLLTFLSTTKAQVPKGENDAKALEGRMEEGRGYIEKKLNGTMVPEVVLENLTLENAAELMRLRSVELDTTEKNPEKKGVNIVVKKYKDWQPAKIGALRLKNVPLHVVLLQMAHQSKTQLKVDGFAVTFLQPGDPGMPKPKSPWTLPVEEEKGAALEERKAIEKKLNAIIIPNIEILQLTLDVAAELVMKQSAEFDKNEKDPANKGIKLAVKKYDDWQPRKLGELHLRNVPVHVILRYMAEGSGTELQIDGSGVAFVKPAKPENPDPDSRTIR